MREIFVEESAYEAVADCWTVTDEYGNWFASFKNKEDAHDYADLMRLRP